MYKSEMLGKLTPVGNSDPQQVKVLTTGTLPDALASRLGAPRAVVVRVLNPDYEDAKSYAKAVKDAPLPASILKTPVFTPVSTENGVVGKFAVYPLHGEILSEVTNLSEQCPSALSNNDLFLKLAEDVARLNAPHDGSSPIVHGAISPETIIIGEGNSPAPLMIAGLCTLPRPVTVKDTDAGFAMDTNGLRAVGRALPLSAEYAAACSVGARGSKASSLVRALEMASARDGASAGVGAEVLADADFVPPVVEPIVDPVREDLVQIPQQGSLMADDPSGYGMVSADASADYLPPSSAAPSPSASAAGGVEPVSGASEPVRNAEPIQDEAPTPAPPVRATADAHHVIVPEEAGERMEVAKDRSRASMFDSIRSSLKSFQGGDKIRESVKEQGLLTRRNLLIGTAGLGVIVIGGGAIGAFAGGEKDSGQSAEASVKTVSTLDGYADAGSWSLPVAASAQVYAAAAGVLVMNGVKCEVHSYSKGSGSSLRRAWSLDAEPDLAFDSVVSGQDALLVQAGRKVTAWLRTEDAEGKSVDFTLGDSARINGSGEVVLLVDGDKLSVLTVDGLVKCKSPESAYTVLAADRNGLISVAFDAPVLVTDKEGKQVTSATLSVPEEGWSTLAWVGAGHGKIVSLWAQDAYATDPGTPVKLAVHQVKDGSLLASKDMSLSQALDGAGGTARGGLSIRPLRLGQGGKTAVFGHTVINLGEGTMSEDIPEDRTIKKIKGNIVVAEDKTGTEYVYSPTENGVKFNGTIMAQVNQGLLIQRGNALTLLPSNKA